MDKLKAGYQEGLISIATNTGLFVLKMWAGIVTGSIAITADAWHSLSDSISSIVVIVASKLSSQKPDKEHPFGHGRWEQIATLLIAFILGIVAYEFLKDSIAQFRSKEGTEFGTAAIVAIIISILAKEALAQYAFYLGRKTGNSTVKADGWHHRTDALSSLVILIGILFAQQFWWIDSVLGLAVSLMIFYATYEIARDTITKLLGEKPSPELMEKITSIIDSGYQGNLFPHHFHIHNYVEHQELTFHIKLHDELSIMEGHRIATTIENKLFEHLDIVATIHIEPLEYDHKSD